MNPFEMVLGIVIVACIASVLKARYGVRNSKWDNQSYRDNAQETAENLRLRDEVRALKERVQVLERVITDNEQGQRLDREIEKLRDKNRV